MKMADMLDLISANASDRVAELRFRLRHPALKKLHRRPMASRDLFDIAIEHGSDFLSRHQAADGSFRGFLLLPGSSTAWITAHAAFVTEDVPELELVCRKAATYLADTGHKGWAWNARSRIDIDSTATAMLVLQRFNLPIKESLIELVEVAQAPSGGFPTYGPTRSRVSGSGWQAPHPEVTAVVIELLRRLNRSAERIDQALSWLRGQLCEGLLPSYWWEGWAYGIWIQSRTRFMSEEAASRAVRVLPIVRRVPDLPMFLSSALTIDSIEAPVIRAGLRRLLQLQRQDGSWRCARSLRVTKMFQYEAATFAPGRTYCDRRRTFSTVHALAALYEARKQLVDAV